MGWALKDPAAAGAYAMANGCADRWTIESVAKAWAAFDARAAVAWAKAIPSVEGGSRLAESLAVWTYPTDPTLALELAKSLPEGIERTSAFQCMVASALDRSLEEARRLLEVVPGGDTKTHCALAVATELAGTDPRGAVELIQDQVTTVEKDVLLSDALGRWAHVEPKAAADWAFGHMTNVETRNCAVSGVMTVWATKALEDAAAYLASMPEGMERNIGVQSVVLGWGETDPVAALAWARQYPEPDVLETVSGILISQWACRDRGGVEAWLHSLETGSFRDRSVTAYSEGLDQGDPLSALEWALTIQDHEVRASRTERAASAWLYRDREAATLWISNSGLSEEAKARLIRP